MLTRGGYAAAAAWLLSGTAEAEDFYLRAGISLRTPPLEGLCPGCSC